MKWEDICTRFRNLKPTFPNDHTRIDTFPLKRCRMPMGHFHEMVCELDKGISRVGSRLSLANEAAVHEYAAPV